MEVSYHLDWNITRFDLLGVQFSVNLNEIPDLNYNKAVSDLHKIVNQWGKRDLTPLGKITIIKTFLLTKFNHLFLSIPSPSQNLIRHINSVLFKYLWGGKPDKVKRRYVTLDYHEGGLRMVQLDNHIQSLKLTWMTRVFTTIKAGWLQYFEAVISPVKKLTKFGYGWCKLLIGKIRNKFWIDVLGAYVNLCEKIKTLNNNQLMSSPIWFNPRITGENLYFANWFKQGVDCIGDLINVTDMSLDTKETQNKFNITEVNFLNAVRIQTTVKKYIKSQNIEIRELTRPHVPCEVAVILYNNKKTKGFYQLLAEKDVKIAAITKWEDELNIEIDPLIWEQD